MAFSVLFHEFENLMSVIVFNHCFLYTSSHEALAAEVPETFEERTPDQVELDFLTNSSEKVEAQTSMNTFQTELDEQENEELVDYSLKNDRPQLQKIFRE